MKKATKNKFGQYFTPEIVADFMIENATVDCNAKILEPSCGEGVFLKQLNQKGFNNITAYEIDDSLATLFFSKINYRSFIAEKFDEKFDLIIGNPPYIRWQHLEDELKNELLKNPLWNQYFNSLCDYLYIFILKSIELLNENGELIFICPEYWLNTTHSLSLRNYMMSNGYFEKIYHFNETPIFDKVTVSIIIFKYIKKKNNNCPKISLAKYTSAQRLTQPFLNAILNKEQLTDVLYSQIDQFNIGERWILADGDIKTELKCFEKNCSVNGISKQNLFEDTQTYHSIGEICDIGNGLVSGLDRAFQVNGQNLNEHESKATLKVVKAKDLCPFYHNDITPYIFIQENLTEETVMSQFPTFYKHLLENKNELLTRYAYNRDIKFWEWVFLRNFNLFSKQEPRIFVPCKERISNKDYFRFSYVEPDIYPTQDVTAIFKKEKVKESIYYILAMLNNHRTFHWLKHNGIIKGNIVEFSEKPIASIPIKLINWQNENEVNLHHCISTSCKEFIETRNSSTLSKMESAINELF